MPRKSALSVADDGRIETGIYTRAPLKAFERASQPNGDLLQFLDELDCYFTGYLLSHIDGPFDLEGDEHFDVKLKVDGVCSGFRLAPYLHLFSHSPEIAAKARDSFELLSEREQVDAWQAMEALEGLELVGGAYSEAFLVPNFIYGALVKEPPSLTLTGAEIVDMVRSSHNTLSKLMLDIGVQAEAIRVREFEPLVRSGQKLRIRSAVGGKKSAKWSESVEVVARALLNEQRRPGVSDEAALTRTAAILRREHGVDFSAKTLRRYLL